MASKGPAGSPVGAFVRWNRADELCRFACPFRRFADPAASEQSDHTSLDVLGTRGSEPAPWVEDQVPSKSRNAGASAGSH